jgi:transcriptional regulator of acetoin/glycerol metabolism
VLEEKTVTRIGSHTSKPIDVRIIAATHRNLADDIQENRFRADLYYRLCEIELTLPALRERTDLFVLADYFLQRISTELKVSRLDLEENIRDQLASYHWPGNIRELQHILRQAAYQAYFIRRSTTITEEDLHFTSEKPTEPVVHISEEDKIAHAIKESGGNLSRTARLLGIGRTTLYRKMRRYPHLKEIKKQLSLRKNERADA